MIAIFIFELTLIVCYSWQNDFMRMDAIFSHSVCKILMEQNQWALHLFLCGLDQTVKPTGNDVIPAWATLQEVLLDLLS